MKKIILSLFILISMSVAKDAKIIVEEINENENKIERLRDDLYNVNSDFDKKYILKEIERSENKSIDLIDELTQKSRKLI